MLFNSFQFIIFFPLVVLGYFLLPQKGRIYWLIFTSFIFYGFFKPIYLLILIYVAIVGFFGGFLIFKTKKNKGILVFFVILILLPLLFFKYYNFLVGNLSFFSNIFHFSWQPPHLDIILPIGLSFYTFQTLSYLFEVYKGKFSAEFFPPNFLVFVSFFPLLLAGPIERPVQFLPQLRKKQNFSYTRTVDGLRLMLWGLFKKMVVADRLAILVNLVYQNPYQKESLSLILATFFFTFQIYYDFSGYTDIAIGGGKILGFNLEKNFRLPYLSHSIPEFWRRWNITLSGWLRDYIYIPLGGNRVSINRYNFNLMATFFISGLWHGANWTFVVWGLLHGFYCVVYTILSPWQEKIYHRLKGKWRKNLFNIGQILITFCLVSFAWIFFRSLNLKDAFWIVGHLFSNFHLVSVSQTFGTYVLIVALILIVFTEGAQYLVENDFFIKVFQKKPFFFRWAFYYILILSIIFSARLADQKFIYFQF